MINNQTYIQNLKITDVPWHRLTTPYGRATDFPGYLAVLEKADDIKAAEKALNELAGNIEHQSTLWQASPFGMVFLTRIFTQALAAGETNPVARYIAAELFDFFTLMANVCEEIEEFEHPSRCRFSAICLEKNTCGAKNITKKTTKCVTKKKKSLPTICFTAFIIIRARRF